MTRRKRGWRSRSAGSRCSKVDSPGKKWMRGCMVLPAVGARLTSVGSAVELIVVRPPAFDIDIRCSGQPLVEATQAVTPQSAEAVSPDITIPLGKRYVHAA